MPTPYEVLLHAAMNGRQHALHPPGQRRGDLARSSSRCSTRRRRCTSTRRDRGARRPRTSSSPATAAGTDPGRAHDRTSRRSQARQPTRAAERRRAVAVPADRRATPSCRTATPARWSRPTARSTGCAFRASTRPACSAPCSTARPAPSGSGRSASTTRRRVAYEPGTNTLLTTWKTPTGWILVRDALTMGPRARRGRDHSAHPAAGRRRRRPHARAHGPVPRRARSRWSWSASRSSTTAARRPSGRSSDGDRHAADATGAGQTIRLQTDMAIGIEGDRVRARHVARAGRAALLRAVVGRGPRRAGRRRRGQRAAGRDHALLARLAGPGAPARPPLARADPALGAGDQGPHLHADRRDRGGADDLAARRRRAASATGTTASPGCATRPSRCRRCTSSTSTGRPTSSCSSSPTSSPTRTARCRSCTGSTAAAT